MTSARTTSRAIAALVEIMRDNEAVLPRRRIEACEHLLDYECPPSVIEEAKTVLMSIVENGEKPVDIKLEALKLLRRVEARKVSPGRGVREANIEIGRAVEIARRQGALLKAGIFPYPDGYADDLYGPDYVPMPTEDGGTEPVQDIAVALRNARLAHSASVLIQKAPLGNAGKKRVKSRAQKSVLSHTQNS
jgi:predicted nucleic acid-binding protein